MWAIVIGEREFHNPKGENVRWAVGQPLGALSSFPMFSLWHHVFVEYCADLNGIKSFRDYQIVGDDIVIWNSQVAATYKKTMSDINIPINMDKSLVGCKQYNQFEFCKRISIEGIELSGLKGTIVSNKTIFSIIDLIELMHSRKLITQANPSCGDTYISSKCTDLKNLLLMLKGYRPDVSGNDYSISKETFVEKLNSIRKEKITEKIFLVQDMLCSNESLVDLFSEISQPQPATVGSSYHEKGPLHAHPLIWSINRTGEQLGDILQVIWSDDDQLELSSVEYLPIPSNRPYFFKEKSEMNRYYYTMLKDTVSSFKETQQVGKSCSR
jgi:hypothetical protein